VQVCVCVCVCACLPACIFTCLHVHAYVCVFVFEKLLFMCTNGCGPGGTLHAHIITLGMVQRNQWATSPPQVDLPAPAHRARLIPGAPVYH